LRQWRSNVRRGYSRESARISPFVTLNTANREFSESSHSQTIHRRRSRRLLVVEDQCGVIASGFFLGRARESGVERGGFWRPPLGVSSLLRRCARANLAPFARSYRWSYRFARLPDYRLGSGRQLDATSHLKLTELCLIM